MQVAVRSYLIAGVAAAGAAAIAIAPIAPQTDVAIPATKSLAVQPASFLEDLFTGVVTNTVILGNGVLGSGATTTNVFIPALAALPAELIDVIKAPATAPAVLNSTLDGVGSLLSGKPFTNVPPTSTTVALGVVGKPVDSAPGAPGGYFIGPNIFGPPPATIPFPLDTPSIPGPFGITDVPSTTPPSPLRSNSIRTSVDKVENNLITAGVPGAKVLKATTLGTRGVVIGVVQANGLVRSSVLGQSPQNLQEAILGDPSVTQKVNPITGHADNTSSGVSSIRRLGAIGTVSKSVQNAVKGVADSVSP